MSLKGVIKHGTVETSSKKFLGDRPAAGKTGTYEDNTNATFVGFTTQLSAAVWMGNPLASGTDAMRNIPQFTDRRRVQRPRRQPAVPDLGGVHRQGQ